MLLLSPRIFLLALCVAVWIALTVGLSVARALAPVAQILSPAVRLHGVDDGGIQLRRERQQLLQFGRRAVKGD